MKEFAAACAALMRLGSTSVARMLRETSIARTIVCCCLWEGGGLVSDDGLSVVYALMNEPSVVAIHLADHSGLAVGHEAKAMLGRTPGHIAAIRPLKHGVIADFDVTEKMLHYFITTVHRRRTLVRPRIVVGVPSRSASCFRCMLTIGSGSTYSAPEPAL